jgi:hypothetical protein
MSDQELDHVDVSIGAILEIIKSHGPLTADRVEQLAADRGLRLSQKELQLALNRKSGRKVWPPRSDQVAWVEEATPQPREAPKNFGELISDWLKLDVEKRQELELQITDALSSMSPESAERQVAAALSIGNQQAISWEHLSFDFTASEAIYERIVSSAIEAQANRWLVEAAARLTKKPKTQALEHVKTWPAVDRSEHAASFLSDLAQSQSDRACAQVLQNLSKIFDGDQTPLFLQAVLKAAPRFSGAGASDEEKQRNCGEIAALFVRAQASSLHEELDRSEISTSELREWLGHLSNAKDPAVRVELIAAIASSRKRQALFDKSVFAKLDLFQLGEVLSADWAVAESASAFTDACRQAVRVATGTELGKVLTAAAKWPVLESLLPLDLLQNLASRDSVETRILREIARPLQNDVLAKQAEEFGTERASLLSKAEHAASELAVKIDQLQNAQAQIEALEEQLRNRRLSQAELSDSEIRQARTDVLRSFVLTVRAIRDALVPLGSPKLLFEVVRQAELVLKGFDVEVLGEVGNTESYDPHVHEQAAIEAGSKVEILSPGYRVMNTAIPLLYAQVRETSKD